MNNEFDIIEDETMPYPEKPKRKGKPVDWLRFTAMFLGVFFGVITGVIVSLVVGGWIGQASETVYWAMFPDGLPVPQKELLEVMRCIVIPAMASFVFSILGFIARMVK
jgi:hypothetical protein